MKSVAPGPSTFPVEVTNVSTHGFWIFVGERELFAAFKLPSPRHLYWPELDVDLAVESIEHPEKYPLVSQVRPQQALQPTSRVRRSRAESTKRSRAARG